MRRARCLLPLAFLAPAVVAVVGLALAACGGSPTGGRQGTGGGSADARATPAAAGVGATSTVFGVLDAQPQWLRADRAAGIRLAVLNIDWARWEPERGKFDGTYAGLVRLTAATYRRAGLAVAVDVGLQAPPRWVLDLPNGHLVDQAGIRSAVPDYEFSATVQRAAAAYVRQVVAAVGPVAAYRIGLGSKGEAIYPNTPSGALGAAWWAYGASAQGRTGGRPPGVAATPMPGWRPGDATWHHAPVTDAQVASWYAWYVGALEDALRWEMAAFRRAGFTGTLEVVAPGDGAGPSLYDQVLAERLVEGADDPYGTMATGAVYWRTLDSLPRHGTALDISSVGDGSGLPGRVDCQPGDGAVPLARADPRISGWSDTRWLVYLAGRIGLPVVGENPGDTTPAELPGVMGLVTSCHLGALQWAWDSQLRQGDGLVSLSRLRRAIASLPGREGSASRVRRRTALGATAARRPGRAAGVVSRRRPPAAAGFGVRAPGRPTR